MGSIFIQFPKGKRKALTLSYDDGVEQDIRLIEIIKQQGLKGTFNLNSGLYAEEGTVYPPCLLDTSRSLMWISLKLWFLLEAAV